MITFLDTNALIYLVERDSSFHDWAEEQFARQKAAGAVVISDIVYSEFAGRIGNVPTANMTIARLAVERHPFTDQALMEAAKAFIAYRQKGGTKERVLPDFLIGAQAFVEGAALVTNDTHRYATYFPDVSLISPNVQTK